MGFGLNCAVVIAIIANKKSVAEWFNPFVTYSRKHNLRKAKRGTVKSTLNIMH